MHAEVADFFLAVSELVPFVAYVNDLQWARAGTADLLGTLFSSIDFARSGSAVAFGYVSLAVIVATRSRRAHAARLVGRQLADVIELKPLSREEVGDVIGSMLGIEELPAAFVERVSREAAGNPFFVQEIMRVLINTGSVYAHGGEWAARKEIPAIDIPT